MARRVREVRDMEIDEVSLVDRPANQFAKVAIAKRAPEEETVSDFYDEQGEVVDLDSLEFGDVVQDDEGNLFEWSPVEDTEGYTTSDVQDLVGAGVSKSLAEQVREDLSKAFTDVERNETISKALEEVSKAEERAQTAERIAKSERDLRLTREYIGKAAEYNVPIAPEELGPVLMRMAESMDSRDCAVIHKALTSSGEVIFQEIGYTGGGDNNDIMSMVDQAVNEGISKSADGGASHAEMVTKAFENDDSLYEQYMADRTNR